MTDHLIFHLPPRAAKRLAALARLDEKKFDELRELLGQGPVIVDRNQLFGAADDLFRESSELGMAVIGSLMGIAHVQAENDYSISEIQDGVRRAVIADTDDEALAQVAAERVSLLLESEALALNAKISRLTWEAGRPNFLMARTITEVRPVWLDDPSEEPRASVVAHVLEIEVSGQSTASESLFIACDDDDLDTLADAIDRARQKSTSLRTFLAKAGLASAGDEHGN